jgi:hypothetical protein
LLELTPEVPEVEGELSPLRLLRFSPEAFELYREFARHTETSQGPDGSLASLEEWASKLTGATVRLAGLLHLADHAEHPTPWEVLIAHDTFERAVHLALEYFVPHARLAFDVMTDTDTVETARRLLVWIQRNKPVEFRARDAHRALHMKGARELVTDPALRVLEDHGYIRPLEAELTHQTRGGPVRTTRYRAHPRLL